MNQSSNVDPQAEKGGGTYTPDCSGELNRTSFLYSLSYCM